MDIGSEKRILEFTDVGPYELESPQYWKRVAEDSEALVLMYDVTSKSSFERAQPLYQVIKTSQKLSDENTSLHAAATATLVQKEKPTSSFRTTLVGNKIDMLTTREVSAEEGAKFAAHLGCKSVEVSIKEDVSVDILLNKIIDAVRAGPMLITQPKKKLVTQPEKTPEGQKWWHKTKFR
ncbi:Ras GTPase ras2 [Lambiella insularis]|nr:Ras GTPase ras2 [Lambiella insularis]